jgi:pyridoxine 5-phosphate synthase
LTIDLSATPAIRAALDRDQPDPIQAAVLAELAGADGIAFTLKSGRQNTQPRDLAILGSVVKTRLSLSVPPLDELIEQALSIKPAEATFFADSGTGNDPIATIGFDVPEIDYQDLSARLSGIGISVRYYIEPDVPAVKQARKAGADGVVLSASAYTSAAGLEEAQRQLDRLDQAAQAAAKAGLSVACCRGLDYANIEPLVQLDIIDEFIVGGAILARASLIGIEPAVRRMRELVRGQA